MSLNAIFKLNFRPRICGMLVSPHAMAAETL